MAWVQLVAKVVTVSDSVAAGDRDDRSGPAVRAVLTSAGFAVAGTVAVPDGVEAVRDALQAATQGFAGLVVTTGGTGFSPRDLTPEGTEAVIERRAPGLAESMRAASPHGRLTRGVAGTVGRCLVVNLPGSPAGAAESLSAILDALPHALALLSGEGAHDHP